MGRETMRKAKVKCL